MTYLSKAGVTIALSIFASSAFADTLQMSWVPPSGMTPGPIEGTRAVLSTNAEGATMQVETTGLKPGHVVTIWWVAVQSPENCKSRPCGPKEAMGMADLMNTVATNAGGTVVDENGNIRMNSFLPVGSVVGNFFETNFTKPETSEFHFVVHDHGPLIPEVAADMLSSYRGGCTDESIPPYYPDSARADGQPGANSCNTAQVALFVQRAGN